MKNSILVVLALGALTACKKTETQVMDPSTDTTSVMTPTDSTTMPADSTAMQTGATAADLSDQDKMFTDEAAKGGMMEVMMGELAATNATNAKVKALGAMMVKDHGKANDELKTWAGKMNHTLPTAMSAEQQKNYDDLKTKKGADFDKAYTKLMVSDHEKDIASFKKQSAQGSNADLKSFAAKTLPTLEHHLMESKDAMKAVQ